MFLRSAALAVRAALVALILPLLPMTAAAEDRGDAIAAELARIATAVEAVLAGDFTAAEPVIRREAAAGSVTAQVWLGVILTEPGSPFYDLARGMALLEAGAAAGQATGATALGRILAGGRPGLPPDMAAAAAQLERALALDPADLTAAQLLVQIRAVEGQASGDFAPFLAVLAQGLAAHPDDPFLRLVRADAILSAVGHPLDYAAALADLDVAARGGQMAAMEMAADITSNGREGVPRDPARAFGYYRMMAEAGNTAGDEAMAGALLTGDGVPADPVAAQAIVTRLLAADPAAPGALMLQAWIDAQGAAGRDDPALARERLAALGFEGLDAAGIALVLSLLGPVTGSGPADAVEALARCEAHRADLLAAGDTAQAAATAQICAVLGRDVDPALMPEVAARAAAIRAAAPAAP